ncbi:MAG TPA: lysophospholipid acyltransferase family protein [Caulobacteraceae bacterium]|jgi:1-acyl-sn-glycerol-3-phosphate acyltransferase
MRGKLFTGWLFGVMTVVGLLGAPLMLFGPRAVLPSVRLWVASAIWGLRVLLGVRVEFRGLEHAPKGAALIAGKHMSMLDTLAPFRVLNYPCFVLKRELLSQPVFGAYMKATRMIPIDREAHAAALRRMTADARDRLAAGRQIIIFPEGTRQAPGAAPDYKPGVAALYRELGLPCHLLATNSGAHWPAQGTRFTPGVAVFEFLPPIPPGLKRGEFMRELERRLQDASNRLL